MNAWNSIVRALVEGGEWTRLNESFEKDWYTVPEAVRELNKRGAEIHPETLRRWIRSGKVKVTKPSPRKTLIQKTELVRLLASRAS